MILALPLLAASLWALTGRKPCAFLWYFFAQIAYIPTVYGMAWAYGQDSRAYLWTYMGMTGLLLVAAVLVAWNALGSRIYRLRACGIALILAAALGKRTFVGLLREMRPEDWLVLIEAVVLLWAGILMAYVAKYQRNGWEYFTLGVLWLGYALWDFGLILHYPAWLIADWYVPSAWLTLGFIVMGFLLRVSRVERRHARRGGYVENKG